MKEIVFFLCLLLSRNVFAIDDSFFDTKNKTVNCAEPLPNFTLSYNSNPSKEQVKNLCSCIWRTFPDNGWEHDISKKIKNKQNPGPRINEFVPKFGEALKKCGGYKL